MKNLQRPLPEGHSSVDYKNHFELRYLRWDYLVKAANPSDSLLKSKEAIVRYCARRAFEKYIYEFSFMGMSVEDIESISRVYTVSYLGLYSALNNDSVKDRHVTKLKAANSGRYPSQEELEKKDNRSLISFLDQRLMDCAYIFRQRSKGQVGFSYYAVFMQKHGNEWPDDDSLVAAPTKYGWEKVSWNKFVKIKDMFSSVVPGYALEIKGKIYRVASPDTSLVYSNHDIGEIFDSPANSPLTPEESLIYFQETDTKLVRMNGTKLGLTKDERLAHLAELFKLRPLDKQERILRRLISWLKRRNGSQKEMREEIEQATKLLNSVKKRLSRNRDGKRDSSEDRRVD